MLDQGVEVFQSRPEGEDVISGSARPSDTRAELAADRRKAADGAGTLRSVATFIAIVWAAKTIHCPDRTKGKGEGEKYKKYKSINSVVLRARPAQMKGR